MLRVQTFGRFAVWRDGELLPSNAWGREKARRLFQYLITHRDSFSRKERIVDDLWPRLDERRANRDFKVALNAVQAALEPDRQPRAPSAYITRQGGSYCLDPAAVQIDAVEFEAALLAASRSEKRDPAAAIAAYRAGLDLYEGAYLPDALYEDWAGLERERLLSLFLAAATRLARLLLAAGETIETVLWCHKVLAIDRCWEEAYRLLMQAHLKNGNRPKALHVYEQCVAALEAELGIEPLDVTRRVYEQARRL